MAFKKRLKRILWVFVSLIMVLLLGIGVLTWFVFTPKKLTPLLVDILNKELAAEVQIKKVELTFFSSFPRFGVKLEDLSVRSMKTGHQRDTLAAVKTARISFNLYQYLKNNDIVVHRIRIIDPSIYAYAGDDGETNWEIIKPSATTDTTSGEAVKINDITIKNLKIENARVNFEDRISGNHYRVDSFSMNLKALKTDDLIHFSVSADSYDVHVLQGRRDKFYFHDIRTTMELDYDRIKKEIKIEAKDVAFNKLHFKTKGLVKLHPKQHTAELQLTSRLSTNSLEEIFKLVPEHLLPKHDLKTSGELDFTCDINGLYGDHHLPDVEWKLALKEGKLEYKDFPGKIDRMEVLINGHLYPTKEKPSWASIEKLQITGTGIDLDLKGKLDDITDSNAVNAHLKAKLDLTELASKFPIDSHLVLKGKADLDLHPEFSVKDIMSDKFDRINIAGTAKLNNLILDDSQDSFFLHSKNLDLKLARETAPVRRNEVVLLMDETSFHYKKQIDFEAASFDTKATLAPDNKKRYVLALRSELKSMEARSKPDSAEVLVRGLKLKGDFFMKDLIHFYRDQKLSEKNTVNLLADSIHLDYKDEINVNAGYVNIDASGSKARDSGLAVRLNAQIRALKANSIKDSLNVVATNAKINIRLAGNKANKTLFANTDFILDSAGVRIARNFLGLSNGNFHVKLQKRKGQKWKPEGSFDFRRMLVRVPELKAPIRMPATKLSFVNDDFMLDHAHIKYLESDVMFSGKLVHARGLFNGQKVEGNLLVESEFINANQLMNAFSGFEDEKAVLQDSLKTQSSVVKNTSIATAQSKPGTEARHAFRIPDSLAFGFTTNIKRLHFGGSDLDNVRGKMTVRNGKVVLDHLKMKTLAADLDATLDYIPSPDGKSLIDFTFYLSQIELNKLRQFLPILDTLMPMANSFMGKAEFRIKGKTTLDEKLEIDMKSFKGIAALQAADIMVLDGPTFRDLAKTLMFKNKELNPIQKLTVEMEFNDNDVNILPSLVEIDRYKLAVGGVQHLDLTYDYHISVLKSPVPFKTGVDLAGKNTEFKINVTKAKYKYYFTDKERLLKKADPAVNAKRVAILKSLGFEDEKVELDVEVD